MQASRMGPVLQVPGTLGAFLRGGAEGSDSIWGHFLDTSRVRGWVLGVPGASQNSWGEGLFGPHKSEGGKGPLHSYPQDPGSWEDDHGFREVVI